MEDYWYLILEMLREEQKETSLQERPRLYIEPPKPFQQTNEKETPAEEKRVIILDV